MAVKLKTIFVRCPGCKFVFGYVADLDSGHCIKCGDLFECAMDETGPDEFKDAK